MSGPDAAIRVEKLGKRYRIGRVRGYRSLREEIVEAARAPFRYRAERSGNDDFWALRDVSFDIGVGEVAGIVLLGSMAFSSLGMWLGTAIAPQQIGLMFSVIIAPMLFFGCAYYPWRGLDVVPVMKYLVLINPMVYVSEGMRGALTPAAPHMPLYIVAIALIIVASAFWMLGMRSFYKRAIG